MLRLFAFAVQLAAQLAADRISTLTAFDLSLPVVVLPDIESFPSVPAAVLSAGRKVETLSGLLPGVLDMATEPGIASSIKSITPSN